MLLIIINYAQINRVPLTVYRTDNKKPCNLTIAIILDGIAYSLTARSYAVLT